MEITNKDSDAVYKMQSQRFQKWDDIPQDEIVAVRRCVKPIGGQPVGGLYSRQKVLKSVALTEGEYALTFLDKPLLRAYKTSVYLEWHRPSHHGSSTYPNIYI